MLSSAFMLSALTPGANNEPRYPLKYFDIADEYATECAEPVADAERTPLAHYFQLLLTRLMNNEEISEEAQHEMAAEAGINPYALMRSQSF